MVGEVKAAALLPALVLLLGAACAPTPANDPPSASATAVAPPSVAPAVEEALAAVGRYVVVTRVIDGDTIAVGDNDERVRLLTINAPELHANTKADDADCGAVEARDALAKLLPIRSGVLLNGLKGEPATDRYGRTLASVYAQHVNVALWMVEQGRARVYEEYPTSETADAKALQAQAQTARRGIWGTC